MYSYTALKQFQISKFNGANHVDRISSLLHTNPVVRLLQNSPVLSFNTSNAHAYMHTNCIVSHALLESDTSFFTVTTDRAPN